MTLAQEIKRCPPHRDIYETCTGYLEQVRDGHLSLDDAWDAILDKIAHLDDDAACEINRLCFAWEQKHKLSR